MNDTVIMENRRMMRLLSEFLTRRNDISREILDEVAACGVGRDEAYALLMAGLCGVDTQAERAFYERYFRSAPRALSPDTYLTDAYRKNVRLAEARQDDCEIKYLSFAPCEAFVCGDISMDEEGREHVPIGYFAEGFTYPALLKGGREWMTITPLEIETMRPAVSAARGNVVTYGLGMGYFAYMAAMKSDVTRVEAVERDTNVISIFEKHIRPLMGEIGKKITVTRADAFAHAADVLPKSDADTVFCDLWHDAADGMEMYLRFKALESGSPRVLFSYWIENTLMCYLANART